MHLFNAQANVSVNFIFLIVGLLVSSALPPLAFLLTWKRVPKGAAIAAAIGGQAAAVIAWLVHTKIVYETVDINTTQVSTSQQHACMLRGSGSNPQCFMNAWEDAHWLVSAGMACGSQATQGFLHENC